MFLFLVGFLKLGPTFIGTKGSDCSVGWIFVLVVVCSEVVVFRFVWGSLFIAELC